VPKKIFFLINSLDSGGGEKVLSEIANNLVEEYDVNVFLLENKQFYELDKKVNLFVIGSKPTSSGIKKLLNIFRDAVRLKRFVKQYKIELIQSHLYRANYVNVLAKLLGAGHKVQIVNHGIVSEYKKKGFLGKINLFLFKLLYPRSDKIIWVSKIMKRDANKIKALKVPQKIIYNPVNINKINALKKESPQDFVFESDKKYIISVGRLISFKRHQDIIKSFKHLDNNIELIILGDGELKEYLHQIAKQHNVEKRVHFLGNVKNPYKYIARSDILVHASQIESFGNVIVEALACGVPVISSDCGGPREILSLKSDTKKHLGYNDDIELADYGVLYPVGNIEKLLKSIRLLLNNKNLYESYSEKALLRAEDFSAEKIICEYKKVIFNEENCNNG